LLQKSAYRWYRRHRDAMEPHRAELTEDSVSKTKQEITFETAKGDARWKLPPLTADQVRALPGSVRLVDAALALDMPRELAYEQAAAGALRRGDELVPVRMVGARYKVDRADLLWVLRISEVPGGQPVPPARPREPAA
jgi:hypothetical protein